jgi:hypothetical protein
MRAFLMPKGLAAYDRWALELRSSAPTLGSEHNYRATKLLRTDASFFENDGNDAWALYAKQAYQYDASLDYLTQAPYDDDGNSTWDATHGQNKTSQSSLHSSFDETLRV